MDFRCDFWPCLAIAFLQAIGADPDFLLLCLLAMFSYCFFCRQLEQTQTSFWMNASSCFSLQACIYMWEALLNYYTSVYMWEALLDYYAITDVCSN